MDGGSKKSSLKGIIQDMIPAGAELIQGTVTSASPLKIQIANDSKLTIGETITVVPRHLADYQTTADITWDEKTSLSSDTKTESGDNLKKFVIYGAKLTVHNALKEGEVVHILSLQNGKKYYVLDRV